MAGWPSATIWSLPVVTGRVGSSRWKMSTSRRSTSTPSGRALLADLVPGAPQHDRRMVAVAADEVRHVTLGPFGEVLVVALRHLADGPLVEGLRHDQEAQAVAQVEELGAGGLCEVRMALTPIAFSSSSRRSQTRSGTAAPSPPASWCRLTPRILTRRPLSRKPRSGSYAMVRMPNGVATTSTACGAVPDLRAERVEVRRLDGPEPRRGDRSRCSSSTRLAGGQRERRLHARDLPAGAVEHDRAEHAVARRAGSFSTRVRATTSAPRGVDARRRHVGPPWPTWSGVGDGQPDVAVDAAARCTSGSWAGASCRRARRSR